MGFFSTKSTKSETAVQWINLTDLGQLQHIISESSSKPVVIFKHSTRCSVSRMALKQFESEFEASIKTENYFLDLLNHRDISNQIENIFNIEHQSPQLLLIKNGVCTYHVSHSDIDALALKEVI
jgi:bacillithiol system protein YtxJ